MGLAADPRSAATDLRSSTGHEAPVVASDLETSNSMGLFLQKTNIIRDYLEDLDSGRTWWPQEVWSVHVCMCACVHMPVRACALPACKHVRALAAQEAVRQRVV